jgi:hypothetical protein
MTMKEYYDIINLEITQSVWKLITTWNIAKRHVTRQKQSSHMANIFFFV